MAVSSSAVDPWCMITGYCYHKYQWGTRSFTEDSRCGVGDAPWYQDLWIVNSGFLDTRVRKQTIIVLSSLALMPSQTHTNTPVASTSLSTSLLVIVQHHPLWILGPLWDTNGSSTYRTGMVIDPRLAVLHCLAERMTGKRQKRLSLNRQDGWTASLRHVLYHFPMDCLINTWNW